MRTGRCQKLLSQVYFWQCPADFRMPTHTLQEMRCFPTPRQATWFCEPKFMTGQWGDGLRYLFPVLAFAIGVVAAERIQNTFKYAKKLHWRQMILLIEILILFAVGFMPGELDMLATVLVSFSCCHAGTDLPEGGRLFLCKHYVHRKFTKRHGGVVRVLFVKNVRNS